MLDGQNGYGDEGRRRWRRENKATETTVANTISTKSNSAVVEKQPTNNGGVTAHEKKGIAEERTFFKAG